MAIYISILRGINVSGQKSIKMTELRALYESLNLLDVTTYIQSGNVVFRSKTKISPKIIEEAIKKQFGFDVPVIVRSLSEWKRVIDNNPYIADKAKDASKLHVAFLDRKPAKTSQDNLLEFKAEQEAFLIQGQEVYLFCPNGYGKTRLSNNNIEKALNAVATTRNWKTTIKLFDIASSY